MASEILVATSNNVGLKFDPRTKLLLLLTMAVFVLGGFGEATLKNIVPILSFVPFILLISSKRYLPAFLYTVVYLSSLSLGIFVLPHTTGFLNFIILATSGTLSRFLPSVMMGYFVVSTTTVSEFVAAMNRMHISEKIIIPLSVMFRFFPTVIEEASSINDAMRMRGISLGGKNPGAMLEYRLVPMLTSSVKIGEELSAAALTRGLGAPIKRTNICKIGFHIQDILVIIVCLSFFVTLFLSLFHVI